MANKLILIFIVLVTSLFSQKSPEQLNKKKESKKEAAKEKRMKDTIYIINYNSSIIFGFHYSVKPSFLYLNQKFVVDSTRNKISQISYKSNPAAVIGFDFTYDKISFSLEKAIAPNNASTHGKTEFRNLSFQFGGNKFIIEANYRNYKGMYDERNSDTITKKFYYRPDLQNTYYMLKFLYFTNHKRFAFRSNYSSNMKQNKTAYSWVITANGNYNVFHADSSLIDYPKRMYYSDYAGFRELSVFAVSVYGGGSINLAMGRKRHLALNFTLLGGPEYQHRTYKRDNLSDVVVSAGSASFDLRFSLGVNRSHYFLFFTGCYYQSLYNVSKLEIGNRYGLGSVTIGWRIHTKYPKFYQRIQRTKLYQWL